MLALLYSPLTSACCDRISRASRKGDRRSDDKPLYLWCMLDGFLTAHALEQRVRIETHCPASGTPIEIFASPHGVDHVTPVSTVMSIVRPPACGCSIHEMRRGFCDFVNFYGSREGAINDTALTGAAILTVSDALELAELLIAPLRAIARTGSAP
jgi:alkylmercury lyase